ncbi:6-phosphogluconate dehydrogenase, C-terminal-like protein [Naviculisporaceae sp. PSN 640]
MDIKQIGMIGVGSMGGMLSLLFAEHSIHVHFYDPDQSNVDKLLSQASDTHHSDLITHHPSHESLCNALSSSHAEPTTKKKKIFFFSLPHGGPADASISSLSPFLSPGDIIIDAANEHWRATERRQRSLLQSHSGVHYIGMGVSGGYQAARHGPSMSPGGDPEALDAVMPFLETIAARDEKSGRPCVRKMGPGGSGHYVKMVHNGIEHGMMTAFCEAWEVMTTGLGMGYDEVGEVFKGWSSGSGGGGGLRGNYLVGIGAQVCEMRAKGKEQDEHHHHVLGKVKDKVVQDVDNSEGTGTWAAEEGIRLHVPHPTIAVSHLFRVASARAAKREAVAKSLDGGGLMPGKIDGVADKETFVQRDVQGAVYAAFLLSFIQGLHVLSAASRENGWHVNILDVLQVWRAGCIIQSDAIVDFFEEVYKTGEQDDDNLLASRSVAQQLHRAIPGLKQVVVRAIDADLHVPALTASLEFFKYSGSTRLPTQFEEAELDYFGAHMFDLSSEGPGKPVTGSHHFEWKEAKGIHEE